MVYIHISNCDIHFVWCRIQSNIETDHEARAELRLKDTYF